MRSCYSTPGRLAPTLNRGSAPCGAATSRIGLTSEFIMAEIAERAPSRLTVRTSPWRELIRKEDWWAIWIGLGLIAVAIALFANGSSIKWIAVAPQKWSHLSDAAAQ